MMNGRQHIVEEWKGKLATTSSLTENATERFAWVRVIYARVYRFLVARYGDGDWRADCEPQSASNHQAASDDRMAFVQNTRDFAGLPPKSTARIRSTLDLISENTPHTSSPRNTCKVKGDSWIIVTARRRSKVARNVWQELIESGIEARLESRTTDTAINVRHKDFEAALRILRQEYVPKSVSVTTKTSPWSSTRDVGSGLLAPSVLTLIYLLVTYDSTDDTFLFKVCGASGAVFASLWLSWRVRR
jgi:hypothetical protein